MPIPREALSVTPRILFDKDGRGSSKPKPVDSAKRVVPGQGREVRFPDPKDPSKEVIYYIRGEHLESSLRDTVTGEETKF